MSELTDLVNSLRMLKETIRSAIILQQGAISCIEKLSEKLIHDYQLILEASPTAEITTDYSSFQNKT